MFGGSDADAERVTGIGSAVPLGPNEILRDIESALAGQGYLEWVRYSHAAELHRTLDAETIDALDLLSDTYTQCAARLAAANRLSQIAAEHHLTCALALRDRLPHVAEALKRGLVAAHHIAAIVARTDLIEGTDHAADIDREIADYLHRQGSWSKKAMRDMIDSVIFRRDPTLVREDRTDARNKRGVWSDSDQNGMGHLNAILSAEHTAMIMQRLEKLATSACRRDPRTKPQRMSDALFAITMAREFSCQCDDDPDHPCTADILTVPSKDVVSGIDVKIVLHAIANQTTLDGHDEQPGYLEGHGVITADHARDLADHTTTTIRPMGNPTKPAPVPAEAPTPDADPEHPDAEVDTEPHPTGPDSSSPRPDLANPATPSSPTPGTQTTEKDAAARPPSDTDGAGTTVHTSAPTPQDAGSVHPDPEPESAPAAQATAAQSCPTPAAPAAPNRKTRRAATKTMNLPAPPPSDPRLDGIAPDDWAAAAGTTTEPFVQAVPLPPVQPGDHYRPSAVLDAFIRIRDIYCMWPGCDRPAWKADLDHTTEYNHDDPAAGGHTHPAGMKALCRFHHMLKTHTDWLDDQHLDRHGRTRTIITTPEGRSYHGPAWTGDDLFPTLRKILWDNPPPPKPTNTPHPPPRTRTRTRTQTKHQRRQKERARNRIRNRLRRMFEEPEP